MAEARAGSPASYKPSVTVELAFAALSDRVSPDSLSLRQKKEVSKPQPFHRRPEMHANIVTRMQSTPTGVEFINISSNRRSRLDGSVRPRA